MEQYKIELEKITELMVNGNWNDCIAKFKTTNPSAREFQDFLEEQPKNVVMDFAILGFYAREYKPK